MSSPVIPTCTIYFTKDAQKQYNKLPTTAKPRIARMIAALSQNPFNGKKLGGELSVSRVIRAWPYRIIYIFDEQSKRITIGSIIHRQGAYK